MRRGRRCVFAAMYQLRKDELLDRVATTMGSLASHARRTPNIAVDPAAWGPRPAGRAASCRRPPGVGIMQSPIGPSVVADCGPRQTSLHGSWEPKKEEETDAAVAHFFYHDHIAFKSARSPYFLKTTNKSIICMV